MAGVLELAARELAKEARKRGDERRPRTRRGATLRPGADTALWNALAEMGGQLLKRRGARAILARELGVHRARIGEYFDTRTAMPDGERALRLLLLIARAAQQDGEAAEPAATNVRNTNI